MGHDGPVSDFLVTYLDSIDEHLLEYLDEDDELKLDTVQRLSFYKSALLEGSITAKHVEEGLARLVCACSRLCGDVWQRGATGAGNRSGVPRSDRGAERAAPEPRSDRGGSRCRSSTAEIISPSSVLVGRTYQDAYRFLGGCEARLPIRLPTMTRST